MKKENTTNRRNFLKAGGAMLATTALPAAVLAQKDETEAANSNNNPLPIYLHGCAWNSSLPGVFGQACFSFDVRADIRTGMGLGTIRDDVHPQVNSQFQINYRFAPQVVNVFDDISELNFTPIP